MTLRKLSLALAISLAAGLLFTNIYTSVVDARNWGANIPSSIQTTRDYFKAANPGTFYRIFSPANQVAGLLALILCWRAGKRVRIYCAIALVFAVGTDMLTFAYFYPRNDIMFKSPIATNLEAIKTALEQWRSMNWFRSLICAVTLVFDFLALNLVAGKAEPSK
ncbi:DUF1772 domain-containing protein [Mucilaginibacter sp. BT774]|uniref:DUF1772 domain-containing protein n=1 Tax=Mucilaginibacter sp. BT774 TaxID=3062276 RepID=UPI002675E35A|nr:DUF1772 domain-containing protein [Mucilaginibacter sp. BT774]MDO3625786.1 DUF1772 domain-containing protein [Mucilaginibacter sp. BT774]